jgi:hypothetical protein
LGRVPLMVSPDLAENRKTKRGAATPHTKRKTVLVKAG